MGNVPSASECDWYRPCQNLSVSAGVEGRRQSSNEILTIRLGNYRVRFRRAFSRDDRYSGSVHTLESRLEPECQRKVW